MRPRQRLLLDIALPRLRLTADALAAFSALWLEVGFGGGEHARALAADHPDIGLIACEVFENGICSLLAALVGEGDPATAALPANLRIWDADARRLLLLLPDACLDALFLMFPDPWPKARHAKRRFVHPETVALLARVMRPGGEWRIASDDPTYQAWVDTVMGEAEAFRLAERSAVRPAHWPPTRYEAKALREGRQPLYWRFLRNPLPEQGVACRTWRSGSGPC